MAHRPQTSLRDHAGNTDARQCSAHRKLRRGRAGRVPRCADRIVNTPCAQVRIWDSERVFPRNPMHWDFRGSIQIQLPRRKQDARFARANHLTSANQRRPSSLPAGRRDRRLCSSNSGGCSLQLPAVTASCWEVSTGCELARVGGTVRCLAGTWRRAGEATPAAWCWAISPRKAPPSG